MSDRSLTTTAETISFKQFIKQFNDAWLGCLERERESLESKRRLWIQIVELRHDNNLFRLQLGINERQFRLQLGINERQYIPEIPPLLRAASLEYEPEKILHF